MSKRIRVEARFVVSGGGTVRVEGDLADPSVRAIVQEMLEESHPEPSPEIVERARRPGFSAR